jgi:hypothetical protein
MPYFRPNLLLVQHVSLLLFVVVADRWTLLFGTWSSGLDTIVDWVSCMISLILQHPVAACIDAQELDI